MVTGEAVRQGLRPRQMLFLEVCHVLPELACSGIPLQILPPSVSLREVLTQGPVYHLPIP